MNRSSLPGYEETQTDWLPVPPPQTEVNVGMVSQQAPTVTHAAWFADGIEITFSKYMDMDSVRKDLAALDKGGKSLPITVTPLNAEKMVEESRGLEEEYTLTAGQTHTLKLQLTGEGGYETMAFTAEITGGSCVKNVALSSPDNQGAVELRLDAADPGRATLRIREESSGYIQTIQLIIAPQDE